MRAARPAARATAEAVVLAVLLAALLAPGLDMLAGLDRVPAPEEKRAPAPPPALPRSAAELAALPAATDAFLRDHFGFRNALLRLHGYWKAAWLRVIPPGVPIVAGPGGWLFYTGEDALASIQASNPFSAAELAAWRRGLTAQADWLARRGGRLVVVIAPAKASIYPEELPEWVIPGTPTRLDQLAEAMTSANLDFIDPRAALRVATRRELVYQPDDTHWNDIGAHVAYTLLLERLGRLVPGLRPLRRDELSEARLPFATGDLGVMLNLSGVVGYDRTSLQPRASRPLERLDATALASFDRPPDRMSVVTWCPQAEAETVVFFHDSFGMALAPRLAWHFRRTVQLWTHSFPVAVLERERPQVVVHEIAERLLGVLSPPENPLASVAPAGT